MVTEAPPDLPAHAVASLARWLGSAAVAVALGACSASTTPEGRPEPSAQPAPIHGCAAERWTPSPRPPLRVGHPRPAETQGSKLIARFSPGARFVTTTVANDQRVWDARDGRIVREGIAGAVFVDETRQAYVGTRETLTMDVTTGARATLPARVGNAAISPDGRHVATVKDAEVRFYDTGTGELVESSPTTASAIWPVSGTEALFATSEGTARALWSWSTRKRALTIDDKTALPGDHASDVSASEDGTRACVMGWKGVRVIDVASGATRLTREVTPPTTGSSSGEMPATVEACAISRDGARVAIAAITADGVVGYGPLHTAISVVDASGATLLTFQAEGVDALALDATGAALEVRYTPVDAPERCERRAVPSGEASACAEDPEQALELRSDGRVTLVRPDGTSLAFDAARGIDRASFGSLSSPLNPYLPRSSSNPSRVTTSPAACGERKVLARGARHLLVVDEDQSLYDCDPSVAFPDAMRRFLSGAELRVATAMYSDDERVLAVANANDAYLFEVATLERFAVIPASGLTRLVDDAAVFAPGDGELLAYRWSDCATLRFVPVRDGDARGWVAISGTDVEADAVGTTFLAPDQPTTAGVVRGFLGR